MALLINFFTSASSTTPEKAIPANEILSFDAVDAPAVGSNPATYQIVFSLKTNGGPKHETLDYLTSGDRDTAIAAVKTAINSVLA